MEVISEQDKLCGCAFCKRCFKVSGIPTNVKLFKIPFIMELPEVSRSAPTAGRSGTAVLLLSINNNTTMRETVYGNVLVIHQGKCCNKPHQLSKFNREDIARCPAKVSRSAPFYPTTVICKQTTGMGQISSKFVNNRQL